MSGNTELRVLYVGYTNKISVFTSGLSDSAEVKCDGCNNLNKTEDEGVYVVTVSDEMPTVRIYVEDKEITKQKASEDFSWTYRVISFPKPRIGLVGLDPMKQFYKKEELLNGYLSCLFVGSPLSISSSVTGGTITIKQNGINSHFDFNGNKFPNTIEIQELMTSGATIMIEIRALLGGQPVIPAPVLWMIN